MTQYKMIAYNFLFDFIPKELLYMENNCLKLGLGGLLCCTYIRYCSIVRNLSLCMIMVDHNNTGQWSSIS
jgi:hypothetical protein